MAVIDPQTGEVRAMAAVPSYDPNPLASHRPDQARRAYNALDPTSPDTVLLSNANDELTRRDPRSRWSPLRRAWRTGCRPTPSCPTTPAPVGGHPGNPLANFGESLCPGGSQITLAAALEVSCNVAFGGLGIQLGGEALAEQAERFGFGGDISFDIPFTEGQIFSPAGVEDAEELDSPSRTRPRRPSGSRTFAPTRFTWPWWPGPSPTAA